MNFVIVPNGNLQINDAKITYRNFAGAATRYNHEGDRNFALIIPDQESADILKEQGWNIHIKPPREEGDTPFMYMQVKLKFTSRGPAVWLVSGNKKVRLEEANVGILDDIDIDYVDLDIHPYRWTGNYGTGVTAWLDSIRVVQRIDRFSAEYDNEFPG